MVFHTFFSREALGNLSCFWILITNFSNGSKLAIYHLLKLLWYFFVACLKHCNWGASSCNYIVSHRGTARSQPVTNIFCICEVTVWNNISPFKKIEPSNKLKKHIHTWDYVFFLFQIYCECTFPSTWISGNKHYYSLLSQSTLLQAFTLTLVTYILAYLQWRWGREKNNGGQWHFSPWCPKHMT